VVEQASLSLIDFVLFPSKNRNNNAQNTENNSKIDDFARLDSQSCFYAGLREHILTNHLQSEVVSKRDLAFPFSKTARAQCLKIVILNFT
jgi:hypothetical protein